MASKTGARLMSLLSRFSGRSFSSFDKVVPMTQKDEAKLYRILTQSFRSKLNDLAPCYADLIDNTIIKPLNGQRSYIDIQLEHIASSHNPIQIFEKLLNTDSLHTSLAIAIIKHDKISLQQLLFIMENLRKSGKLDPVKLSLIKRIIDFGDLISSGELVDQSFNSLRNSIGGRKLLAYFYAACGEIKEAIKLCVQHENLFGICLKKLLKCDNTGGIAQFCLAFPEKVLDARDVGALHYLANHQLPETAWLLLRNDLTEGSFPLAILILKRLVQKGQIRAADEIHHFLFCLRPEDPQLYEIKQTLDEARLLHGSETCDSAMQRIRQALTSHEPHLA
ncbi:hypothetical protein NEOLI_001690 [Neolecta irregularis DAH-3]|uniref:Uncharacterized protein n=1 Tax=Neolecta irregularis (strain DAH-3) TaxID=1198029 RepID=A0A1U7LGK1_NEOID|nr:hypothetical protein NEOLI_001690 [Neolecta irregularis DAH-3]|eukprot:OLL21723.1 hypothetical protein NEOLI_001690 [Neolecta irregularis DAH-3]